MAWTTPKTDFNAADVLGASDVNKINANIVELKDPPSANYEADEVSDYSGPSVVDTWEDIDGTNWALTITTNGGDVMVGFHAAFLHSSSTQIMKFDVDVDGVRDGGDDGYIALKNTDSGSTRENVVSFTRLITGLSAGSHTFKIQWNKNAGAAATLYAGAGTTDYDIHPQFWVREVS